MQGVLAGFATIGIIIGLGFLLAQLKVLDATALGVLTRVAFYVASPALMITVLGSIKAPTAIGEGEACGINSSRAAACGPESAILRIGR